ncbi:MAG: contractile injection system tape measure protein, partial [Ginsengibacter sp.]
MMQHIIKKQVIDLSLDKKLDAFFIQQKVSDEYYSKILPMLLQAFDAVSNDGEVIEIDSLSVDIGTIDSTDLDKGEWTDIVVKKITEQLIDVNLGLSSNIKTIKKTRPLSSADQWIYYMRHGYLPWNVLSLTEDWYSNVLSAFAGDSNAISKLRDLIKNDPGSVIRMVSQNSENFLRSLVETLTAENQSRLTPLINKLAQINSSSGKNKIKLWVQTLLFVASEKADLNPEKIADHLESNSSNKGIPEKKENTMIYKNEVPEEG